MRKDRPSAQSIYPPTVEKFDNRNTQTYRIVTMEIIRIPVLSDNYIFLILDLDRQIAAVVDPAEAAPVHRRISPSPSPVSRNFQYTSSWRSCRR